MPRKKTILTDHQSTQSSHPEMKPKSKTGDTNQDKNDTIRIIKTGNCPSLSGQSELGYQVGVNANEEIMLRVVSNSGGGQFNRDHWSAFIDLENHLLLDPKGITSLALHPFFKGMSANSPAFLLAVLLAEGIVNPSESKRRCYDLGDSKPFLESMRLLAAETTPQKRQPRKKSSSRKPSPPKAGPKEN